MDLIVWARDNPVLVVAAVAIAALVVVAIRMARVPDSAEEPHPSVPERPGAERALPARAPFARSMSAPTAAPAAPTVPRATVQASAAGYVPLDVPELWEPPVGYLGAADPMAFAGASAGRITPSPQPVSPVRYPARSAPFVQPAPRATAPPSAPPAPSPTPRSFDDLRRGALAGRAFDSLQQFAVAAVVEAGHPVVLVARIFRVPTWKLENWVEASFHAAPAPTRRPWRGTMPRTV